MIKIADVFRPLSAMVTDPSMLDEGSLAELASIDGRHALD
jgi:hypothetical protein